MRVPLALVVAAALAAGCSNSNSSSSSGSSGGSFIDAHDRCVQRATAACQHDATCGYIDPSDTALCLAAANCDSTATEGVTDEQIDAGQAQFDATAFSGCLSDIQSAPCAETAAVAERNSDNCDQVSFGQGGQGASCVAGNDCQTGFSCVRASSACGGTCQAWLTSGSCAGGNHAAVARGYYCGDDGGVSAQVGQGQPCSADNQCSGTMVCVASGSGRACGAPGTTADGGACSGTHDCLPGLTCVLFRERDAGLVGSCVPRGAVDASCAVHFPDGGAVHLRDGGARTDDALCLGELFCDPATATCQPQAKLGQTCAAGGNPACLEGTCIGGSCAYADDGQRCSTGSDCKSGACTAAGDGGGICGATCP